MTTDDPPATRRELEDTNAVPIVPSGQPPEQNDGSLHPLTAVLNALLLLGLQGLSVGFYLWTLLPGEMLRPYVLHNEIAKSDRHLALGIMLATAALFCSLALVYLAWRRRAAVVNIVRAARRCAPLMLVLFLPLLFDWQIWIRRENTFVAIAAGFALGTQALFYLSLSTAPVLTGPVPAWSQGLLRALAGLRQRLVDLIAVSSPWLPWVVVCAAAAGYALYFSYYTVLDHRNLGTAAFDLGIWDNATWNTLHGGSLLRATPALGPEGSHLARHATFFVFPLAAVYAIAQNAETLLIVQAVMMGAAALPLFLYARLHLGAWTACVIALLYLLYPPLHGSNLYEFHFLPLGAFFVWWSLYLIETRRNWLAVVAVLLALSIREDIAAGMIVVGVYLLLCNRRPAAGLMVALVAACYLGLLVTVIMPAAAGGHSYFSGEYADLLPGNERRYTSILKTLFGNPVFTISQVLEKEKLFYLLQVMAPLAFLPWRRPVGLLFTVPGFFFCLLAHREPFYSISFQYTTHWTIYLFIAVVANLAWVGQPRFAGDALGRARFLSWLAALVLAMLANSYQFGAVLQQNTAQSGYGRFHFGTTEKKQTRYLKLRLLIDKVPARAKIAASERVVPHISNRPDAYAMKRGIFDAEYILYKLQGLEKERKRFRKALASGDFGVVHWKGPFVLAERGAATDRNDRLLRRLKR